MIRSPFLNELFSLHDAINRNFSPLTDIRVRSVPSWSASSDVRAGSAVMPLDVYTTDDAAVIVAAIPGVHPHDLDVSVHKNTVTISCSGQQSYAPRQDDQRVTWYVSEIGQGAFRRSVTLPFAIDEEKVEAQYANGLLRLTLPKIEAAKPHRITVRVSGEHSPAELTATSTQAD